MNKEVKEILDYLKNEDDYIEDLGIKYKRININNGDLKALLDYIAGLQNILKLRTDCLKMNQDRIDKAIEYIKHYGNLYCLKEKQFKNYTHYRELLNILKGEDKE